MATGANDPIPSQPHSFSIRLPRPVWIAIATISLVIVTVGLRVGLPRCRQQAAIWQIERLGGSVRTLPRGPEWLRNLVGDRGMTPFDEVRFISFLGKQPTDG